MEIKNALLRSLDPYRTTFEGKESVESATGRGRNASATSASPQGDRVSLSSSARLHTAAHATALAAPEVRREKVDALKQLVESGEYEVDARAVAEKLLESEALLANTLDGGAA